MPGAALRPTFVYRHRQLADDLAAHRDAPAAGAKPMVVAVTGASGPGRVGAHGVSDHRRAPGDPAGPARRARTKDERQWRPDAPAPDLLSGVDAVVHLAGASIAGRFTAGHKAAIRDSRIEPTRRLAQAAADSDDGPSAFVSASAIGIYGFDRGDALLCEESVRGDGFLADVVADWEAATGPPPMPACAWSPCAPGSCRPRAGGTLRLLRPLFLAGLGGRMGSGRQWLSWIGLDDLVDVYYRALYDTRLAGPVNAVGPAPVRNIEYTKALARVLHRPAVLPVPSFGPRLLLGGQGARELAEADQRVVPTKLTELGHRFRHATVDDALAHQLGHG